MATLLAINNYHYRRGGAEVVHLEHIRLFEDLNWRVVPFAMRHKENSATRWDEYFVDEIEFGGAYSLGQRLARAPRVVYSLQARQRIGQLLDDVHVDVAHAHNIYHHISPSVLGTLKERGVPVLLTLHDLKLACPAYKMFTHDGICERCRGGAIHNVVLHRCIKNSVALSALVAVEATLHRMLGTYARHVDRMIVPSRFLIRKLVEWGWPEDRFRYIPNFVDLAGLDADRNVGRAFLYVGRLETVKGVGSLIRAAAKANVPLRIVGTGPDTDSLRAIARSFAELDVEFLGYQSGAVLRASMRAARAIVLPSELYENAPISVLEAYSLGRPVIGARIGGIPELVRDDETGASFESGDVDDLAAVLRRFAALPDQTVANMGAAGRHWVEQQFTPAHYRERVLEQYRELGVAA